MLPADPPPPRHSTFQNMVRLHIKLKGITNAATWSQIFYPQISPPPVLRVGSTFLEYGHVAYQIKGNDSCSNMQIFYQQTPTLGVGQNLTCQNMVKLHIKLKGFRNEATLKQIFCPQTPPPPPLRPWGWGQNSTFSEHGHVAYQIKHYKWSNMVAQME